MRGYGVLLHISSLPSAWGIGDIGPAAHAFSKNLAEAGAGLWQFLPLTPTSIINGNSPYSSPSAFAGNTLLISPEFLVRDGWVSRADLDDSSVWRSAGGIANDPARIDYEAVALHRQYLLNAAFARAAARLEGHEPFMEFVETQAHWLTDYARFVSIKAAEGGKVWTEWPKALKQREPDALARWDINSRQAMQREMFAQYLFFSQWAELRETCARQGVALLADIPIYVTHDSADVWANPEYFNLDQNLEPATVSGVPPDYFSATGQRWGSPVYRWDKLAEDGFGWWKRRFAHTLLLADMVRLDHFRGFCGYWEIDAAEKTAVNGTWKKAPGKLFFETMREHFKRLPFLAEDLGVITPDVRAVIHGFDLPGMIILQFAFDGADAPCNLYIPHNHQRRSFVYTGTHDNAPTRAWFMTADQETKNYLASYVQNQVSTNNATHVLSALAFGSVADWAVLPMQDVLNLGEEGRMNMPGVSKGNWAWRMRPEEADNVRFAKVRSLAEIYGRLPWQQACRQVAGGEDTPEISR